MALERDGREALNDTLRQILESGPEAHDAEQHATAMLALAGLELSQNGSEECSDTLENGRTRHVQATGAAQRLMKRQNRLERRFAKPRNAKSRT